ncbi:MAG: hypothetical protein E7317_10445 [Clostridiales bacterium]|nr:hypothetical protein [Clostridiales bacterium]
MIRVILGDKGSGKTKKLLDATNAALKEDRGNIIFIDDDKRYMYDLHRDIRFVDASEYPSSHNCSASEFLGFLCGMLSSNYDLTLISVDAFKKLVKTELDSDEMRFFFKQLGILSERHGCDFVISIGLPEEKVPDYIRAFA